MKTAGIIAEYNPFHEGHKYHIEETRRRTGAEYIIVVMSGDFVQRGEPAVADKYVRTKMALLGGADLVIELPVYYATASAEAFAMAGVSLLDRLGLVDVISFGSEWASREELSELAGLLAKEEDRYQLRLKEQLKAGLNYPAARARALSDYMQSLAALNRVSKDSPRPCKDSLEESERVERILREPNHILAIEYMKAIRRCASSMECLVIQREGQGYHDRAFGPSYASAAAIRRILTEECPDSFLKEGSPSADRKMLPARECFAGREEERIEKRLAGLEKEADRDGFPDAEDLLRRELGAGYDDFMAYYRMAPPVDWDRLMSFLHYIFLFGGENLERYAGVDRDLAARIRKLYEPDCNYESLIKRLHARNRTDSSLARALLHIVLQHEKKPYLENRAAPFLPYARVLGFRKKAAPLLKEIRQKAGLDIIQKPSLAHKLYRDDSEAMRLFLADTKSADFYEFLAGRGMPPDVVREQIIL